jgi:hypothetical protein
VNVYEITYRFAGGPVMVCEKAAATRRNAQRQLYAQIGCSRHLEILRMELVEK